MIYRNSSVFVCLTIALLQAAITAEEFSVTLLTDDEQFVLRSIQEKQILETVSFLASDEMNGRDTPSKELNIAANYVAERFQKAGLEGLGPEGSFFQTAEFFALQLRRPRQPCRLVLPKTSN